MLRLKSSLSNEERLERIESVLKDVSIVASYFK
jgi:hypothetical protein